MLTDKQVILGSALFILLLPLEVNKTFKGRRLFKKINRAIKKELAIYREHDRERYLKLVFISHETLKHAKKEIRLLGHEEEILAPDKLLALLSFKYPKYFNSFNIDKAIVKELSDKYSLDKFGFFTIKFTNILVSYIERITDKYIEEFDWKKADEELKKDIEKVA